LDFRRGSTSEFEERSQGQATVARYPAGYEFIVESRSFSPQQTRGGRAVTGDHRLVFEDGRLNGRTLRDWIPEVVEDIVASVEPAQIILFGSAARGEMGPDSDLDLLVVLDELDPADRAKLMGEIRFAISAPMAIDIFVTDVGECERRRDVVG